MPWAPAIQALTAEAPRQQVPAGPRGRLGGFLVVGAESMLEEETGTRGREGAACWPVARGAVSKQSKSGSPCSGEETCGREAGSGLADGHWRLERTEAWVVLRCWAVGLPRWCWECPEVSVCGVSPFTPDKHGDRAVTWQEGWGQGRPPGIALQRQSRSPSDLGEQGLGSAPQKLPSWPVPWLREASRIPGPYQAPRTVQTVPGGTAAVL